MLNDREEICFFNRPFVGQNGYWRWPLWELIQITSLKSSRLPKSHGNKRRSAGRPRIVARKD